MVDGLQKYKIYQWIWPILVKGKKFKVLDIFPRDFQIQYININYQKIGVNPGSLLITRSFIHANLVNLILIGAYS